MTAYRPLSRFTARIERVDLYRVDVQAIQHFSWGTMTSRQHVLLRLSAGGCSGWGECLGGWDTPMLDVGAADWIGHLGRLKGLSIAEAAEVLQSHTEQWGLNRTEAGEQALIDLAGKLSDTPALELLDLPGRDPGSRAMLHSGGRPRSGA